MAHVLIVDDDEIIAELATQALLSQGFACGWINNGEEALELVRWKRPDLMLLDQDMPGMSGGQVLRTLRSDPALVDLPVVMFTAITGTRDEDLARYNGAQGYVRKPFDPDKLLLSVRLVLSGGSRSPAKPGLAEAVAQSSRFSRLEPEMLDARVRY